jgi:hypothetical protein
MLTYDNSIQFAKGKVPQVALRNFYPPEDGFVWSSGYWSEISFGFSAAPGRGRRLADVILDFDAFKKEGHTDGQNVLLYFNGLRVGSHFIDRRSIMAIPIDPATLKPSDNVLTVDTPNSRSPSEFGSADGRQLGIQLFSMQIRPAG